jgi:hypothetical protein
MQIRPFKICFSRCTTRTYEGLESRIGHELSRRTSVRPMTTVAFFLNLIYTNFMFLSGHFDFPWPSPILGRGKTAGGGTNDIAFLECVLTGVSRVLHTLAAVELFQYSGQNSVILDGPGLFPLKVKIQWSCLGAIAGGYSEPFLRPLRAVCDVIAETQIWSFALSSEVF